MKKVLLTFLSISCWLGLNAQVQSPECLWGNLFDGATTAGDQAVGATVSMVDSSVYWQLTGGSDGKSRAIEYAGHTLFEGAEYDPSGTSYNNNLVVMKTDNSGRQLWNLHSITCDFANNEGGVASMPDGGVVFVTKVRCGDLGGGICRWEAITLVDGLGNTTDIQWNNADNDVRRYYMGLIGRLDADGKLLWVREIETSRKAAAVNSGVEFIAEALKLASVITDTSGNIYVGGNYRTAMSFAGKDSILIPENIESWNGDSQSNVGDLFLLKIDSEGNLVKTLTSKGDYEMGNVQSLCYNNGELYAVLDIRGISDFDICGKRIQTEGVFNPVILKMDTDLDPVWATVLKGETVQGRFGFQNSRISVDGDNLWFTSQMNGKISYSADEYVESFNGSTREGMLLKFKAEDGSWQCGTLSRESGYNTGLTGYLYAFQTPEEKHKVYVYGYVMNATVGVFLRAYDAETLATDVATEWRLVTGGGVPTAQCFAYNPVEGYIYLSARGNKSFNLMGGETTSAPSGWGVLMAGFKMPENFRTGVDSIVLTEEDSTVIYSEKGKIVVEGNCNATLKVYDLTGRLVGMIHPYGFLNELSLPSGLYICNGKKVMVP
ncbi:MAG: hypothetical protein K2N03_01685 [Muribaculaceae bacterium]|nr:hypothetical protein [Muribaculaceae bacterium]